MAQQFLDQGLDLLADEELLDSFTKNKGTPAKDQEMTEAESAKPPRKVNYINQELKKDPLVQMVDGAAVFLSKQSSAVIRGARCGIPVFDSKDKTRPVALLGAFASQKEVIEWLSKKKSDGLITDKQSEKALVALTQWSALSESTRKEFSNDVKNHIFPVFHVKSKSSKKKITEEKPAPAVSSAPTPAAAEKKAPKPKKQKTEEKKSESVPEVKSPATKKSGGGGGFLTVPSDAALSTVDLDKQPKFKSMSEALFGTAALPVDSVTRIEVIVLPSAQVALVKRLEAPSAAQIKTLQKLLPQVSSASDFAGFKVDKERARDSKYTAVYRGAVLRAAIKSHQKIAGGLTKKERVKKEKTEEAKQEKVKTARAKPVAV